jgi:ubiquinone biosynthesis protein UbiJ
LIADSIKKKLTNHLFQQNEWVKKDLSKHKSKSILFNIGPIHYALMINEACIPEYIEYIDSYDAEIKLTISSAIELMRGNKNAHIEIKGDIEFATILSNALKNIEWDYEDDLSKIIGDIPAYQVVKLGKKIVQNTKETSFNIADTFKEYWLEEKPLIAKKRLVDQFNKEVDSLRFDVDRLEQKLKKL